VPYGSFSGASAKIKQAYYHEGFLHDKDFPELPSVPFETLERENPEEVLYKIELRECLSKLLLTLRPNEAEVVKRHYGINCNSQTLQEIGKVFGLSQARIRQIECKAIQKLKHPSFSDDLKKNL